MHALQCYVQRTKGHHLLSIPLLMIGIFKQVTPSNLFEYILTDTLITTINIAVEHWTAKRTLNDCAVQHARLDALKI